MESQQATWALKVGRYLKLWQLSERICLIRHGEPADGLGLPYLSNATCS